VRKGGKPVAPRLPSVKGPEVRQADTPVNRGEHALQLLAVFDDWFEQKNRQKIAIPAKPGDRLAMTSTGDPMS
jgi:hypothetical protein